MKVIKNQYLKFGKIVSLALIAFSFAPFAIAQTVETGKPSIAQQANLVTEFDVNGLKVLVKRRASSPTVAAGLFVRGGARNITDKNAGIENLMLQVAAEGSKKFPREALRRELARTGSGVVAGINNDYSGLSMVSTRKNFDSTWDIFTDIALNPAFAPADIEQERASIISGLREQETTGDNFLQVLQERIIYANHPYANDVNGTIENLNRFTAKDLNDFHRKVMQTSQLLLVVVGDIDPKEVQTRVTNTFGKLPRGEYKDAPYPAFDFSKPTLDVTTRALPTNYIEGIFNAPSISSSDYSAMRVAIAILASRVNDEVRDKRQLSYAPTANLDSYAANTANIYVTAVKANEAVKIMLDEVNNLKSRQITEDTVDRVAGFFLTNYYIDQQTNAAQVGEIAKYELIGGGWRNAFDFLDKVRAVTPAQVQEVSQKYMKNIRFVVIGDPKAIDKQIFLPSVE